MVSSPQLHRALVLQEQGRHELAEKELRAHLATAPDDGFAHGRLACSLVELERRDEAEQAARTAVSLAPDESTSHFALARVLSDRNRNEEAAVAIREAIRLEPTDADYHALHAAIELEESRWKEALAAAETGLRFDPEHVVCNNFRAMALVKLGRKAEAGSTIASTLAREPENAFSHANQGWTLLENGDRRAAMHHFRESLRLDPDNDWARAGLVEALKAGNPIYSVMLAYFLWMQKLSPRARWGVILGGYFGSRILAGLAQGNPALAPWVLPIRIAYVVFVLFTWLAQPIFNLMLFLHPVGRHALNDTQRAQAKWVGLALGISLLSLLAALVFGQLAFLLPALVFGLLSIPTAAIFMCHEGWPRRVMTGITLLLLGLAVLAFGGLVLASLWNDSRPAELAGGGIIAFVIGTFASQWIANWLATKAPHR